jgi:ribonuclease D
MGRGAATLTAVEMQAPARGVSLPDHDPGYVDFCVEHLDITLVTTELQLAQALAEIRASGVSEVALDVETVLDDYAQRKEEAKGSLRTVQLGIHDPALGVAPRQWIIDCHACHSSPLIELFTDPTITKLIHNSSFEAEWIASRYGVELVGVFDTMIAWRRIQSALDKLSEEERVAAGFGGLKRKPKAQSHYAFFGNALGDLVSRHLGFKLPKDEQIGDWGRRELSGAQLIYGALDVALLPPLTAQTKDALDRLGITKKVAKDTADSVKKVHARTIEPERHAQDDSARVARLLRAAATVEDLERAWALSRQMAVTARSRPMLTAILDERRLELQPQLLAA